MICQLVSYDTPTIIRTRWYGYVPRIGEIVKQKNSQRWLIQGVELAWNEDGQYVLLIGIRMYPLIEE